jgi:hypothetical protein
VMAQVVGSGVFVARVDFAYETDGTTDFARAGRTRVREGDPLLARYAEYFEPADAGLPEIEQATAAPGEKRGMSRRSTA